MHKNYNLCHCQYKPISLVRLLLFSFAHLQHRLLSSVAAPFPSSRSLPVRNCLFGWLGCGYKFFTGGKGKKDETQNTLKNPSGACRVGDPRDSLASMDPGRRAKRYSRGGRLYRSKTFRDPSHAVQPDPELVNPAPQQQSLRRNERERKKPRMGDNSVTLLSPDIANGLETYRIPVFGLPDTELPDFEYVDEMRIHHGVELPPQNTCCTCKPVCGEQCPCLVLNGTVHPYRLRDGSVGLFEDRHMIFECRNCTCGSNCGMRFSQNGDCELEVFHTGTTKGYGVRTQKKIRRGARIGEYLGRWTRVEDSDQTSHYVYEISCLRLLRQDVGVSSPGEALVLEWEIGQKDSLNDLVYTVDALKYGNVTRFINHSCDPNTFAQSIVYPSARMPLSAKLARIVIFASRHIDEYEELTLDYHGTGSIRTACYCNSTNCKGFIMFG